MTADFDGKCIGKYTMHGSYETWMRQVILPELSFCLVPSNSWGMLGGG